MTKHKLLLTVIKDIHNVYECKLQMHINKQSAFLTNVYIYIIMYSKGFIHKTNSFPLTNYHDQQAVSTRLKTKNC